MTFNQPFSADHGCGLNRQTRKEMEKLQNAAVYHYQPVNEYNETVKRTSHLFDQMENR